MGVEDYAVGLAFFAGTTGAVVAAAVLLVRKRLRHLTGAAAVLAGGVLATTGVVAVHLLPGLVGLLGRESVLVVALAVLAGALALPRGARAGVDVPPPGAPSARRSWVLAGLAAAALLTWLLASAWERTNSPPTDVDSTTFHLPNIARWIQSGSYWQVDQFTPLLYNGNYPHSGDVVFMAALLPWENDAFVRLVSLPFLALAGLAVYAIAVELRTPRATAALFGVVFCSLPVVLLAANEGTKTDVVMYACFAAGAFFLLRHFRVGRTSDLVLAGLGLGLSFGTKWYGVTAVAAVLVVWLAASAIARRPMRRIAGEGGLLVGLVALAGGFWLVRNLVESGNPVFPVKVELAGLTIFDAPRDFIRECAGYRIADYVTGPAGVWSEHILPAYEDNYALTGALIALGGLTAVVLALRGTRRRPALAPGEHGPHRRWARPGILALGAASALAALAYALTPYTAFGAEDQPVLTGANTRYLVPALVLATPLCAWAAARAGRFLVLVEAVALVAVADGIRRGFDVEARFVAAAALAVALAAAAAWVLARAGERRRRAIVIAGALLLMPAVAAAGHPRQKDLNDSRYAEVDPVAAWIEHNAPGGRRIGLAGVWTPDGLSPVWPSFGPRLENEVEFVGPWVEEQLREYESRDDWSAAVAGGGYDLLVVGRGGYSGCPVPGRQDDDAWARAEGFEPLVRTDRLTLYRVPGS